MKMENISVNENNQSMPLPPMVTMALNVRTALNTKVQHNEVVMVAVLVHTEFFIDKPPPKPPIQQHFCRNKNQILFIYFIEMWVL